MNAAAPLLTLDTVHYAWPDAAPCLRGVSLTLHPGEKVVLLGPNGGGKSTLLKLMNGLVFPSAGTMQWDGRIMDRASLRERQTGRDFRRRCGLLFQHPEAMLFNPTVRQEIGYGPAQLGLEDAHARVAHWAGVLKLEPLLDKPPFLLSGGQKQKVALACVLAMEPDLLLLDEPAASLDPATVGWLIDTLLDSPRAVVISTHNLSLAAELGERALILGPAGTLLFDGPIAHALADLALLEAANLTHRHRHRHGGSAHSHVHAHDWEAG